MNILVVNDDGYDAIGIRRLVEALSPVADVYLCAPYEQMSGKSHSITITESIHMIPLKYPNAKEACTITGTPADCSKFGIQWMEEMGVYCDMVFSGINMGGNMGTDVQYSGTVGAAMEAAFLGVKAVAMSVMGLPPKHYNAACKMALKAIEIAKNVSTDIVLNINLPNKPEEEIKGIRITELGKISYEDYFKKLEDSRDKNGYFFTRDGKYADIALASQNSDIKAVVENYVSITPIKFNIMAREAEEGLKALNLDF